MLGFQTDMMGAGISWPAAQAIGGLQQLGQTATGNSQATAFALTAATTEFTTAAASTGAVLPAIGFRVTGGDALVVVNNGANALSVYPPVGFKIGLAATNAAVSVASGKSALFLARGDGNYFAIVSA